MMRSHLTMTDDDDDDSRGEEHLAPADPAAVAYALTREHIPCLTLTAGCPSDLRRRHRSAPMKPFHRRTALMMEEEARVSRAAWAQSMDACNQSTSLTIRTDSVPPVHRMTARISIRDEPSISLPPREEVKRLLALTTPPPSPLTPLSSPLPHIPSPLFPASPPASPIRPLGYRAAMIRLRAETPSTSHPLPLPTSSPLLQLLSSDHRTDRPEITLPPRKRLGIDLGPRYEIGESSAAATTRPIRGRRADYGFVDPREAVEEVAPMTLGGVNTRVTELTAVQEQDTQDIYAVIEDTQDRQTQIYQSVGTLVDDSQYHYETARLLDQEALVSREAWGRSIEVSYMTRSEILALRSVVIGQQAVISQLQAADRKSQVVTLEMLQADYQRQVQLTKALELLKGLQTQMAEFQRQLGPAKGPAQPDAPGEAGSSS
ncbi:hypothetical protein Tco_1004565 [Tanacetum coccineum]|uniref:Uncharacterized protein n=1 Tax=Tanacetum coccineum TaxID=301880 RepID=A0ABQ5FE69_9ASTR